jgi:hypothetical protein
MGASIRFHWAVCLLLGWASFAIITLAMYQVHFGPIVAFVCGGGVV